MVSLIVLGLVLVLIAVRKVGALHLKIWQIMLGGALIVVVLGQISFHDAIAAIEMEVMLFLFGMFVLGRALEVSGYLSHLSFCMFRHANTTDKMLLFILFGMGLGSAVLMNDTLAIVGTPVVLHLAIKHKLPSQLLLLALCFAVTIGSVMSPIGNPQNLLIAVQSDMDNPFVSFFLYLGIPTTINLVVTYGWLRWQFRGAFHAVSLHHEQPEVMDQSLMQWARLGGVLVLVLIGVKIGLATLGNAHEMPLTVIALSGAFPVLLLSSKRTMVLKSIDWATLIFFAAMFVLMESVWQTDFFQNMATTWDLDFGDTSVVMGVGIGISQLISNVPLVVLYLPLLLNAGASHEVLLILAAGSTIAGNLFVLGAASNVIVIQNAELRGDHSLTFWAFARSGIPVTALNVGVYLAWFALI